MSAFKPGLEKTDAAPLNADRVNGLDSKADMVDEKTTDISSQDVSSYDVNDNTETREASESKQLSDDTGENVSDAPNQLKPNKTFLLNGVEYKTDDNGKIYSVDGQLLPNETYVINGHSVETNENGERCKIDGRPIEEFQEVADDAAQSYNSKYDPYNRSVQKGVDNVKQTDNGGVSFEDSDSIYTTEDGRKAVVVIQATGNRDRDFDQANKALGIDKEPDGYVWHHVDNYNVKDNTFTLQLVKDEAHNASKPHSGGCAQYDAVYGSSYNPPKKEI